MIISTRIKNMLKLGAFYLMGLISGRYLPRLTDFEEYGYIIAITLHIIAAILLYLNYKKGAN